MVGAVGTQVTNIQEDVSVHPFLSLPSHPRAALAHVAGFGSGQSSLLQAAVPALLWGAELQVIAESAACLWASGAPCCCGSDGRFIGISLLPNLWCSVEMLEEQHVQGVVSLQTDV